MGHDERARQQQGPDRTGDEEKEAAATAVESVCPSVEGTAALRCIGWMPWAS